MRACIVSRYSGSQPTVMSEPWGMESKLLCKPAAQQAEVCPLSRPTAGRSSKPQLPGAEAVGGVRHGLLILTGVGCPMPPPPSRHLKVYASDFNPFVPVNLHFYQIEDCLQLSLGSLPLDTLLHSFLFSFPSSGYFNLCVLLVITLICGLISVIVFPISHFPYFH